MKVKRFFCIITTAASLLLSLSIQAQTPFVPPFGEWKRLHDVEPLLAPQGDGFESAGVFNPSVVKDGGKFVMLYRAQNKNGTSRLGYATSVDGVHFTRLPHPVMSPETDYEMEGGVEDPRLVKIDGTWYLTYTGYNKREAQLCLATSKDLMHWERKGIIFPAYKGRWNVGWTKSGAILPEKVNGKWWMYYMADRVKDGNEMGVAYSDDSINWTEALDAPVLQRRPGYFDAKVVEPGPAPIMTEDGIFLVYNGADKKSVYATGWVLFDKNDPTKVLARSDKPVFRVEQEWEKVGQVPNVVFVEGLVRDGKRWIFYYGGADKFLGAVEAWSR